MLIELTDDQRDFAASVADFCRREAGTREQRDRLTDSGRTPHSDQTSRRIAELGWTGIRVPSQWGGAGGTHVDMCLLLEEVSRGMLPVGGIGPTLIVGAAVERYGSDAQKEAILGSIVAGGIAVRSRCRSLVPAPTSER